MKRNDIVKALLDVIERLEKTESERVEWDEFGVNVFNCGWTLTEKHHIFKDDFEDGNIRRVGDESISRVGDFDYFNRDEAVRFLEKYDIDPVTGEITNEEEEEDFSLYIPENKVGDVFINDEYLIRIMDIEDNEYKYEIVKDFKNEGYTNGTGDVWNMECETFDEIIDLENYELIIVGGE